MVLISTRQETHAARDEYKIAILLLKRTPASLHEVSALPTDRASVLPFSLTGTRSEKKSLRVEDGTGRYSPFGLQLSA